LKEWQRGKEKGPSRNQNKWALEGGRQGSKKSFQPEKGAARHLRKCSVPKKKKGKKKRGRQGPPKGPAPPLPGQNQKVHETRPGGGDGKPRCRGGTKSYWPTCWGGECSKTNRENLEALTSRLNPLGTRKGGPLLKRKAGSEPVSGQKEKDIVEKKRRGRGRRKIGTSTSTESLMSN